MTVQTTKPPPWRDVRVLKWLFQLAVVGVVALIVMWLLGNYRENISRSNVPTDFGFLDNPANFTIPGNNFSQSQPVRSAFYEGLLNTLRVSVAGLVLATVIGTLIGIARLSGNALVRGFATVWVEMFRNVPLLLLLTFANLGIVLQWFPTIQQAWEPLGVSVVSNRGIAVPWFVGAGWGLIMVGLVGVAVAWAVARWRRAVFDRTGQPARTGLWGGVALAAVVAVGWVSLGYTVTLPEVDGPRTIGGIRLDPSFVALLLALVAYTSSHIAEIVRGSIQAVHRGQDEAAQALALSGFQRMWFVVLPQAFRIALPPIGNQYLNLIKNSSLGASISYFDLTQVAQITVGNGSPAVPAFALTLVLYLLISLVTSVFVNLANRRLALVTR